MKKKINLNYYFSQVFVKQLKRLGVKDVCISPGSRNTPLTMAFANERGIKKHIIIDERSSAFFALGIAKAKGIPAAILTTSGTATAELYPAIIEAYNSRIPLIVITADRPPELIDTGANQTIHQANMYANHIRLFVDAGLPKINNLALKRIQQKATDLFLSASVKNRGPVHINFPFRKPLEPFSFNAELEKDVHDYYLKNDASGKSLKLKRGEIKPSLVKKIKNAERPLILAGLDNYDDDFAEQVINLSYKMNAPIIADIYSNLRFGNNCENIISQAGNFLRSKEIDKKFEPDLIIQFGNAPTVNSLLEFF
ncbi:MAG: 2-succinyl-5-enolpyruvyl-6-hydroxy-3-cyclohexene-1-carboxylic-acid synthase, partial [Ignavibacteria bacterium]